MPHGNFDENPREFMRFAVADDNIELVTHLFYISLSRLEEDDRYLFSEAQSYNMFKLLAENLEDKTVLNVRDEKYGETVLVEAVKKNCDIRVIRLLIRKGADHNAKDKNGETLLFYAIKTNNKKLLVELLKFNADVHATDQYNRIPLHYAKKRPFIKILLSCCVDLNYCDINKQTPLFRAVIENKVKIVKELLRFNANPKLRDKYNRTPLHYAKSEEVIKALLYSGAVIDTRDENGETALIKSILDNKVNQVESLIKFGAKIDWKYIIYHKLDPVNYRDVRRILVREGKNSINLKGKSGESILMKFVKADDVNRTLDILSYGAEIDCRDYNKQTPLHFASSKEMVEALVKLGSEVDATNDVGQTALFKAVRLNNIDVLKTLIKFGSNPNCQDYCGRTPLHYTKDVGALRLLLKCNTRMINDKDKFGDTALSLAVKRNNKDLVIELLEHNADVNVFDDFHRSLLHYAHREDIIKVIIDYGANVNHTDRNGDTPLYIAVFNNLYKLIITLLTSGANVNCRNFDDETPIFAARDENIVGILIEYGADIHMKDYYCNTFLKTLINRKCVLSIPEEEQGYKIHEKSILYYVVSHLVIIHHNCGPSRIFEKISKLYPPCTKETTLNGLVIQRVSLRPLTCLVTKRKLENFIRECYNEIELMREHFIDDKHQLSTYDFCQMRGRKLSSIVKNNNLRTHLQECCCNFFPIYSKKINVKIEMGHIRLNLLTELENVGFCIIIRKVKDKKDKDIEETLVSLNTDCIQRLAIYLSDRDVMNLILGLSKKV